VDRIKEILERYKLIPLWGRLVFLVLLGFASPVSDYFFKITELQDSIVTLETDKGGLEARLATARNKKKQVVKLEKQLALTKQQLGAAQKLFPDSYFIDKRLAEFAEVAHRVGVRLIDFKPGEKKMAGSEVKWEEWTITLSIGGSYAALATFQDRLVHLPTLIQTKEVKIVSQLTKTSTDPKNDLYGAFQNKFGVMQRRSNNRDLGNSGDLAQNLRDQTEVILEAKVVLYRALNEQEQLQFVASDKSGKNPNLPNSDPAKNGSQSPGSPMQPGPSPGGAP